MWLSWDRYDKLQIDWESYRGKWVSTFSGSSPLLIRAPQRIIILLPNVRTQLFRSASLISSWFSFVRLLVFDTEKVFSLWCWFRSGLLRFGLLESDPPVLVRWWLLARPLTFCYWGNRWAHSTVAGFFVIFVVKVIFSIVFDIQRLIKPFDLSPGPVPSLSMEREEEPYSWS